jgi:hypothetical protein
VACHNRPALLADPVDAEQDRRAEGDDVGRRGAVLHAGAGDPVAQAQDPGLQMRLLVLGVVVLGVLLEIAPFARGLDALGERAPGRALELA